jgi:heterodisulfide reductase subunit C
MRTIKLKKDPLKLLNDVLKHLKASPELGIFKCVQCGMCSSVCPAAKRTAYDPKEMLGRVLQDDETVVDDDTIWYCFSCYTCNSVCPSGNNACEVNQILRQMAIDKGDVQRIESFTQYGESFIKKGIGTIPEKYYEDMVSDSGPECMNIKMDIQNIRSSLGLGNYILPDDAVNEIDSILKNSGFMERIEMIKGCKK